MDAKVELTALDEKVEQPSQRDHEQNRAFILFDCMTKDYHSQGALKVFLLAAFLFLCRTKDHSNSMYSLIAEASIRTSKQKTTKQWFIQKRATKKIKF